ncbi:hypothetical protein VTH06DRAFT_6045 [Thermothelomyces fergusii]
MERKESRSQTPLSLTPRRLKQGASHSSVRTLNAHHPSSVVGCLDLLVQKPNNSSRRDGAYHPSFPDGRLKYHGRYDIVTHNLSLARGTSAQE